MWQCALQRYLSAPSAALLSCARTASTASSCGTRSPQAPSPASSGPIKGLSRVKSVIAVASGKGGVGKSSVCVNLAYTLQEHLGASVGILDADVYGPSLPSMVPLRAGTKVYAGASGGIEPAMYRGVPLMSVGFIRPGEHAAIRGPMVSAMVQQMLTSTEWGELDYLLIDMPPGTGDIHITVAQQAEVDAAVVVTTPQKLSLMDVEKGIHMFDALKIPTVAVVENMAYFECPGGTRHEIFENSNGERLANKFGITRYFRLAMHPLLSRSGEPFVLTEAASSTPALAEFRRLAKETVSGVGQLRSESFVPSVRVEVSGALLVISLEEGREHALPARTVRLECRSANMRDEFTGKKLFRDEDIPQDVIARKVSKTGRYAVTIDWSDKHSSIRSHN
mmetsp:Transcript_28270/g.49321  ORF Transcript_28270/g.49321 Transcript_28270/m.49321 type:complete len:393 (+) Transcript_28270:64-1242(+)